MTTSDEGSIPNSLLIDLYYSLAVAQLEMGDRKGLKRSIKSIEGLLDTVPTPRRRDLLSWLVEVHQWQRNLSAALAYASEYLDLTKDELPPRDREVLTALDQVGDLYCLMGKYEEALPFHIEALEGWRSRTGFSEKEEVKSHEHLISIYVRLRRYSKALSHAKAILSIVEAQVYKPGRQKAAQDILWVMVGLYFKRGDLTKGLRALARMEKLYGGLPEGQTQWHHRLLVAARPMLQLTAPISSSLFRLHVAWFGLGGAGLIRAASTYTMAAVISSAILGGAYVTMGANQTRRSLTTGPSRTKTTTTSISITTTTTDIEAPQSNIIQKLFGVFKWKR